MCGMHRARGGLAVGTRGLALHDARFMLTPFVDGGRAPSDGRARRQVRSTEQAFGSGPAIGTSCRLAHLRDGPRELEATVISALEFVDGHEDPFVVRTLEKKLRKAGANEDSRLRRLSRSPAKPLKREALKSRRRGPRLLAPNWPKDPRQRA